MRRLQALNALTALAAVIAASFIMGWNRQPPAPGAAPGLDIRELRFVVLSDGSQALVDATGEALRMGDYRRIIAGSIVSRAILGELAEKERIAAVLASGIEDAPDRHRFSGIPRIEGMKDTERILALEPDLIIVNSVGSASHVQRLRDAGLRVFVLGDMRGVRSFLRDIRQIAVLTGDRERGMRLSQSFARRMRGTAADVAMAERKQGIYLSAYGTQMFGGTIGTSYYDLLVYGGLTDAAAKRFTGWPQYTAEHVLSMDPEIIISPRGVPARLCESGPLAVLQACQNARAGFVELPMSWLEDPSFVMLDVVESIREAVYGAR